MTIYLAFAVALAVVLAALLWPVLKRRDGVALGEYDLAVYRDQLAELDRDEAAGLISKADAEGARNEIRRRMLTVRSDAADLASPASSASHRTLAALLVVLVPAAAFGIYLVNGKPALPSVPLADRLEHAVERGDFPAMVAKVEKHLAENPNDAHGWMVIAPSYTRLGRDADAAAAYAKIIELSGPTPELLSNLGESLMAANDGLVSAEARSAFDQALKIDPKFPKARFYRTLAEEQAGNTQVALDGWKALLADAPADAPYKAAVEERIAALSKPGAQAAAKGGDIAPALPPEAAALQNMPADQQQLMIRAMVDKLDERLQKDGSDLDGWLRLARARMVLGERDRAVAALDAAATRFKDDEKAQAQIADARKTLGLN
ncbi:MAG: c-type cytochrome biogenesis protein CcmI [Hyphomicrobiales bacterium]